MPSYVKYETPKDLIPQIVEMLSVAKDGGRVRKGVNETTKSIERKLAQLVVIAEDVTPEEVVVHLPILCEEKGIAYVYLPTKKDLGGAVGIEVGTSAVAVENAGGATEALQGIIKKLPVKSNIQVAATAKHAPAAAPKAAAPAPKPAAHAAAAAASHAAPHPKAKPKA